MPDIPLKNHCFDLVFSPTQDHVYLGLLTGEVKGFSYDDQGAHREIFSLRPTKQSCRGLAVDPDGRRLASVSKDKSLRIIDPMRGQVIVEKLGAHDSAINRVTSCGSNIIATGDDDGVVKLWDPRKPTEIRAYSRHIDYISDLLFTEEKHQLVAASGDCTLTVMDIRSSRSEPLAQSQDQDDEFLSLCSIKSHTKLIVGTQMGMLSIFNRSSASSYAGPVDRMPGHPSSVDALLPLTDDVIATGSSDGLIRLVQILPNKLLGAVADHGDFPVERLGLSRDGKWLGSASHDEVLKLTDVADALEESDAEDPEANSVDDASMDADSEAEGDVQLPSTEPPLNQTRKRRASSSDGGARNDVDSDEEMQVIVKPSLPLGKRKVDVEGSDDGSRVVTTKGKRKPKERENKRQRANEQAPGSAGFFDDL